MGISDLSSGIPVPSVAVDFSWSPVSIALSWTQSGNTYPYAHQSDALTRASDSRYATFITATNQLLTFVASVVTPSNVSVIEYKWGFGNGDIAYGSIVTYTYLIAVPSVEVSLIVTDSLSRQRTKHKVVNLRPANAITAAGGIIKPGP